MPPSTVQRHRDTLILIGLAILILCLVVYFAPFGCRNYLALREDLERVNSEITMLKGQNQELRDEITLLQTDANYIEKIARRKLGMLKKNEMVFEVPEKKVKRE